MNQTIPGRMSRDDVTQILEVIAELYPGELISPERAKLWRQTLEARSDKQFVIDKLRGFAMEHVFFSLAEFSEALHQADKQSLDPAAVARERLARVRVASENRREKILKAQAEVNEQRCRAAEIVDALSPEDRRRLELEVQHDFPFVEGFGLIRHIAARAEKQGLHLQK